jgi:nucleoid-associated protein YgaU
VLDQQDLALPAGADGDPDADGSGWHRPIIGVNPALDTNICSLLPSGLMEHTFAPGAMIRVNSPPHAYRRNRRATRRHQRLALALAGAIAGLVLAGSVAYGGSSAGEQRVVVHAGDTLWAIAAGHYAGGDVQARVAEIEAANHLRSAALSPGQILSLPAP